MKYKKMIKKDYIHKLEATELWCDITNRLINRYKEMADNDGGRACFELRKIEDFLVSNGYLISSQMEMAKEIEVLKEEAIKINEKLSKLLEATND